MIWNPSVASQDEYLANPMYRHPQRRAAEIRCKRRHHIPREVVPATLASSRRTTRSMEAQSQLARNLKAPSEVSLPVKRRSDRKTPPAQLVQDTNTGGTSRGRRLFAPANSTSLEMSINSHGESRDLEIRNRSC